MAIAVTVTPTSSAPRQSCTVSVTGGAATTAYICKVIRPTGSSLVGFTTDGAGAATFTFVPQEAGTTTFEVRPAAEFTGATSAAASTTHTGLRGGH